MPRKYKKRGGGIFDNISSSMGNLGSSMSSWGSSLMPAKKPTSYTPSTTQSYTPYTTQSYTTGGRKRKSKRHMRGGFKDNTPMNNLAAYAAPFSGSTAEARTFVGGRTKRRRNSRKNRRSRRH